MAAEIGTYGSTLAPTTPTAMKPIPSDLITIDWMQSLGSWSQRFIKFATLTTSGVSPKVFSYAALGCELHPPILDFYVKIGSTWRTVQGNGIPSAANYMWNNITLTEATFSYSGNQDLLLMAYL